MRRTTAILAMASLAGLAACGQGEEDASGAARAPALVGTVWQWQEFQDSAEGDEAHHLRVPDPAKYTLTLQPGDAVAIRADCNQVLWTYALEGSQLAFGASGPSTLAHCGEESLDRRFLERLGNAATYVIADGTLHLNLKADGGNLVFVAAP